MTDVTSRILLICTLACAPLAQAQDAAALQTRYASLHDQLASNQFHRPLYLESSQTSHEIKGEVYALIDHPYRIVGPALQGADRWCDILILHSNVKSCSSSATGGGDRLNVNIGRKSEQSPTEAFPFEFSHHMTASKPAYLQEVLDAKQGPLGTSDYRIVLEVAAVDAQRSFIHLSYSYAYGMTARMAMKGYLLTGGRNKVGFSVVGYKPDGQPVYINSMRGVIERNTMRYYLAIEAYLGALSAPAQEQTDKRLNDWYASVERYPVQLHEMDRNEYLKIKRQEVQRQGTGNSAFK